MAIVKTVRYQLLFAALVGGLVGGFATRLLFPTSSAASTSNDQAMVAEDADQRRSASATSSRDDADLYSRLRQLEEQVATLRRQQASRKMLTAHGRMLATDRDASGAPAAVSLDAEDPRFELAVRKVIDRANAERETRRQEHRDERRQESITRQLNFLIEELGLTDGQIEKVEQVLTFQMETFRDIRDPESKDRPVTRREWRQKIDEIRKQTRAELAKMLTTEQLARYDKLQKEERRARS